MSNFEKILEKYENDTKASKYTYGSLMEEIKESFKTDNRNPTEKDVIFFIDIVTKDEGRSMLWNNSYVITSVFTFLIKDIKINAKYLTKILYGPLPLWHIDNDYIWLQHLIKNGTEFTQKQYNLMKRYDYSGILNIYLELDEITQKDIKQLFDISAFIIQLCHADPKNFLNKLKVLLNKHKLSIDKECMYIAYFNLMMTSVNKLNLTMDVIDNFINAINELGYIITIDDIPKMVVGSYNILKTIDKVGIKYIISKYACDKCESILQDFLNMIHNEIKITAFKHKNNLLEELGEMFDVPLTQMSFENAIINNDTKTLCKIINCKVTNLYSPIQYTQKCMNLACSYLNEAIIKLLLEHKLEPKDEDIYQLCFGATCDNSNKYYVVAIREDHIKTSICKIGQNIINLFGIYNVNLSRKSYELLRITFPDPSFENFNQYKNIEQRLNVFKNHDKILKATDIIKKGKILEAATGSDLELFQDKFKNQPWHILEEQIKKLKIEPDVS